MTLRPRIIPCLLVHDKGLVKTVNFKDPKYVGDPINAVKIFNEKEVDELVVLDIDASVEGREPNYGLIEKLAVECRMPFCYGGGIRTVEQALKIIRLGVEKVALSSAAIDKPELIGSIAELTGRQSVVVVLDVKKSLFGKYEVFTHNGKRKAKIELLSFLRELEVRGIGEIVINSIDKDGTMTGYDNKLIDLVRDAVDVPLTAMGGAGNLDHIRDLIQRHGVIGAAAGSLFVFKGVYKAVLINYPTSSELLDISQLAQGAD